MTTTIDWPRRCSCGAEYTREQWRDLHLVGVQKDPVEPLELRDCTCGLTLAIVCELEAVTLELYDTATHRVVATAEVSPAQADTAARDLLRSTQVVFLLDAHGYRTHVWLRGPHTGAIYSAPYGD